MVYLILFLNYDLLFVCIAKFVFPFIAIFFCPRYYYLRNIIENFYLYRLITYNIGGLLLIRPYKKEDFIMATSKATKTVAKETAKKADTKAKLRTQKRKLLKLLQ